MFTTNKITKDTKVEFLANVFIVPNPLATAQDYFNPDRISEKMTEFCQLNDIEFNTETSLIAQTWYLSEYLGCDNIPDHGISFINDVGQHIRIKSKIGGHMPIELFKGKKEGDTISIKLPILISIEDDGSEDIIDIDTVATVQLTLRQIGYRYQRFGKFEEVLEALVEAYSRRNL